MPAPLPPAGIEGGKKRKRTGAERERRKQAAMKAKLDGEPPETPIAPLDPDVPAPADLVPEIPPLQSSGDADVDSPAGPSRPAVDFDKLASRVPQALKTLHPVFKQARSFEVRRLVKKIKHLRTKAAAQDELADLEAQLALISHLPLTPVAQSHLLVKLRKHALLKSCPLPSPIVDLLSPSADTYPPSGSDSKLVGKVENRLCSAKNVAPVVKNAVGWLLGEQGAKLVRPNPNTNPAQGGKLGAAAQEMSASSRAEEAEEEEGGYEDEVEDEEEAELVIPQRRRRGEEESEAVSDGEMDEDELADVAGWESGSVSGGEVGGRRAAYLSGDDLSAESDSESLSESNVEDTRPAKRAASSKASKSQSQALHPAPQVKEKASSKSKTKNVEKVDTRDITSSMFLPSLASGFTRGSDDDSDPDMDFDEGGVIGKKGVPGRKNRRGQRARQAIWEKKYGKNAKHVVKAAQDKDFAASQGQMNPSKARQWGAGKGAGAGSGASGRGGPPGGGSSGTVAKPAGYADRTVSAAPAASAHDLSKQGATGKAVHPSWEAAKMRKMKEAVVQPGGGPKPTKIVFD